MTPQPSRIDSKVFIVILLVSLLVSAGFIYHRVYVAQSYGFYTDEATIPDVASELNDLLHGAIK